MPRFDVEAFIREEWPPHLPMRIGEKNKKPGDGEMATMFYGGDFKLMWDPRNEEEVDAARTAFERLRQKNFKAFKVKKKRFGADEPGEQVKGPFDPEAAELLLIPQVAGGR